MAGPEPGHAATMTTAGSGMASSATRPQQGMGSIGDAAQLVEAAVHARMAASQDQRFATTKTLFFALSSLCGALRSELRLKNVGQGNSESELRRDCQGCVATLQGVLANKKLEMTAPFCLSVGECLRQAFELCESLNAVGAVLDLHKLLGNRKALPESKMAVLEALGDISKAAGVRVGAGSPKSVAAGAKQLKQPEALV
ncbi:unnamed protein product, partial [Laminaria digitata]